MAAGIKPRSWHGPGSTAGALLRSEGIAEKRGDRLPDEVHRASLQAFFGGRFEQARSGVVKGTIYGCDIASAYPYHAWRLPCLEHGVWKHTRSEKRIERAAHAIVRGHIVDARGPWAPLPVRLKNGNIVYPRSGASGWWYRDEWRAARRGWGDGIEFVEAWILVTRCKCRPFDFLRELFEQRKRMGKSGRGKVVKLASNSVAGKLAQSVGDPQFSSRVWSGMLMSGTRAQLLDLMLRHKRLASVLAVATDGLYSTEKVDLPPSECGELGSWEREAHKGIVLVRPGIYWTSDGIVRARGLGRKTLDEDRATVVRALARGADRVTLSPRVVFGAARQSVYVTPGGAIKRSPLYGQWSEIPSRLSLRPEPKRAADWRTVVLDDLESEPYRPHVSQGTARMLALLGQIREASDL